MAAIEVDGKQLMKTYLIIIIIIIIGHFLICQLLFNPWLQKVIQSKMIIIKIFVKYSIMHI